MRYISLFSGIEAASVAWGPLGWEPVAFCEVDPFPSAILANRYPDVPNLGDITKVDWKEVVSQHGAVDVVVGGSPCQSFSISGGRESLGGESRLMFEYIRACGEIQSPWIVWENVPGVFSVKDGAFEQLITSLQDVGYGSIAWRVLDAQFVRVAERDGDGRIARWVGPVAQRRRRVFLVGHLGASGGSAAAVLFESGSVCGNIETSREKRTRLTANAGRGADRGCEPLVFAENQCNETRLAGKEGMQPIVLADDNANTAIDEGMVGTLKDGGSAPILCMASGQAHAEVSDGGKAVPTISARNYKDPPIVCMASLDTNTEVEQDDMAPTLTAHIARGGGRSSSAVRG